MRRLAFAFLLLLFSPVQAQPQAAGAGEQPGEKRWLVMAARQDQTEATDLARAYAREVSGVRVLRTRNGWHAVVVGPLAVHTIAEARKSLPPAMSLPSDAYLANGDGFGEMIYRAPDSPVLGMIAYDGTKPAMLRHGDITVVLDSVTVRPKERVPTLVGRSGGAVLFQNRFDDIALEDPQSEARFVRLDLATPEPQVVFSAFSGGAHCCTLTRIATQVAGGAWRWVDAGMIDGEGYAFEDVDGDGAAELVGIDNSFLYAFASYAESFAPPVVLRLSGGALHTVTLTPAIRPYLDRELRGMERAARVDPSLWTNTGFLAGWAAAMAQLGRIDSAWPRVVAGAGEERFPTGACLVKAPADDCPPDKRVMASFPEALAAHLARQGYPVPVR